MIAAFIVTTSPVTPTPAPTSKKMPVVLVPGFMGWSRLPVFDRYMETIAQGLERDGRVVVVTQANAIANSEIRADAVVAAIARARKESGADRVLIVAHSQGGLDTRIALHRPGVAAHVGAVASLATPHRGSPVAAWGARFPSMLVDGVLIPVQWAWETAEPMPEAQRRWASSSGAFSSLAMTPAGQRLQARRGIDDIDASDVDVPYFSVAGFTGALASGDHSCEGGRWGVPRVVDTVGPLMVFGRVIHQLEGFTLANDAIVPAASARFGVFLGCVAADHVDWLGWHDRVDAEEGAPFDEVEFARVLVDGLEVASTEGVAGMDGFVPHLAALASAHPPR